MGENQRYSPWGLSQIAGLSLHPLKLQVDPCFVHSLGNWAGNPNLGVAEAEMARSRPGEVAWAGVARALWMLVWLKLSPQQPGLPGDGRDISCCLFREVLH